MEPTKKWLSMFAVRFGWGVTGTQPPKEDTHFSVYGVDGGILIPSGCGRTISA